MKPGPTEYIAFREAAKEHEVLAAVTGLDHHVALARRLWALAIDKRLAALYPPQRCVECAGTIHSDELMCGQCGRARQGVQVNTEALLRFFETYDFASAEKVLKAQADHADKKRAYKARTWAAKIGVDDRLLLERAESLGNMRLAVESFCPGAWAKGQTGRSSPGQP